MGDDVSQIPRGDYGPGESNYVGGEFQIIRPSFTLGLVIGADHASMLDGVDPDRLERIEAMLTRLTSFLDRWEPILERMMNNPAARFAQMRSRRKD